MKIIVALVIGLLAAVSMGFSGFVLGFLVGYLLWDHRETVNRLTHLEENIRRLEVRLQSPEPVREEGREEDRARIETPEEEPERKEEEVFFEPRVETPQEPPVDQPQPVESRPYAPDREPVRPESVPPRVPDTADRVEAVFYQVKEFLFGGNTLVRTGILVLFFGFVFLIKYAVDNELFPIELRLAVTAAAGIALSVTGWTLRRRRPEFGLALQGGGAAILYLTIFSAYRLFALLPSSLAFALLVVTTALCAVLALLQNSQSLIILSLLGGFFAPVLASTGEGSHIALFAYYGVLNAGVLILTWFRPWRAVYMVGFLCTFGIAGLWVAEAYEPTLFASTEPFLVLFFLTYFVIAILRARHRTTGITDRVDGSLVFGLPVAAFSLQAVLVASFEYGLAWSAFALGSFYALSAYVLYRRSPEVLRMLVESYAGIGLVLGTMVLPFALDATWTGTGWALEGAALIWLGFRQQRILLRLSGTLLQILAGFSFILGFDMPGGDVVPLLNRYYFGFLALSLSALASGLLLYRHAARRKSWEAPLEGLFLAAGIVWWLAGGIIEIEREISTDFGFHLVVLFVTITALLCSTFRTALRWSTLRVPALLLLPALGFLLLLDALIVDHPFASGGFLAWPLGIIVLYVILRLHEQEAPTAILRFLHAGGLWLSTILLVWEGMWLAGEVAPSGSVWPTAVFGFIPAIVVVLIVMLSGTTVWPFGRWQRSYLLEGVLPLLLFTWYWSLHATLLEAGNPAPLQYLPLVNPLDLILGLAALTGIYWFRACTSTFTEFRSDDLKQLLVWALSLTVFIWLNATLARTVHFWDGVPYDLTALLTSNTFETALTIFWTVLSVTTMAISARRGARTPWMVAAVLLGITVVKLFVVDLSSISTVARIITFIVVGLLLLLVGYLAPVPPQRQTPPVEKPDESVPVNP